MWLQGMGLSVYIYASITYIYTTWYTEYCDLSQQGKAALLIFLGSMAGAWVKHREYAKQLSASGRTGQNQGNEWANSGKHLATSTCVVCCFVFLFNLPCLWPKLADLYAGAAHNLHKVAQNHEEWQCHPYGHPWRHLAVIAQQPNI